MLTPSPTVSPARSPLNKALPPADLASPVSIAISPTMESESSVLAWTIPDSTCLIAEDSGSPVSRLSSPDPSLPPSDSPAWSTLAHLAYGLNQPGPLSQSPEPLSTQAPAWNLTSSAAQAELAAWESSWLALHPEGMVPPHSISDRAMDSWLDQLMDFDQLQAAPANPNLAATAAPLPRLVPGTSDLADLSALLAGFSAPNSAQSTPATAAPSQSSPAPPTEPPAPKKRGRKKKLPVDPSTRRYTPLPLKPLMLAEPIPTTFTPKPTPPAPSPTPASKLPAPASPASSPLTLPAVPIKQEPVEVLSGSPVGTATEELVQHGYSKRQERLIKNRAAALLSRQRKRDHLTSLESRTEQLEAENTRLKERDAQMQALNADLTQQCQAWESRYRELEAKYQLPSAPAPVSSLPAAEDGRSATDPTVADLAVRSGLSDDQGLHKPRAIGTMLMLALISLSLFSVPYKNIPGPMPTSSSTGNTPPFESVLQGLDLLPASLVRLNDQGPSSGSPPPSPRTATAAASTAAKAESSPKPDSPANDKVETRPAPVSIDDTPQAAGADKPSLKNIYQWVTKGIHRLATYPKTNVFASPKPEAAYNISISRFEGPDQDSQPILSGTLPQSVSKLLEKVIRQESSYSGTLTDPDEDMDSIDLSDSISDLSSTVTQGLGPDASMESTPTAPKLPAVHASKQRMAESVLDSVGSFQALSDNGPLVSESDPMKSTPCNGGSTALPSLPAPSNSEGGEVPSRKRMHSTPGDGDEANHLFHSDKRARTLSLTDLAYTPPPVPQPINQGPTAPLFDTKGMVVSLGEKLMASTLDHVVTHDNIHSLAQEVLSAVHRIAAD
ncbi:hypothetical protein H4R33_004401 [Dimargaris cristalligena]|nr:hypothetical protein H4R33_004401 [Dimargaris cristalligena]